MDEMTIDIITVYWIILDEMTSDEIAVHVMTVDEMSQRNDCRQNDCRWNDCRPNDSRRNDSCLCFHQWGFLLREETKFYSSRL